MLTGLKAQYLYLLLYGLKVFARSREVSRQVDTAFSDIWDINCEDLCVIRQGELKKKKKKRCTFIKR